MKKIATLLSMGLLALNWALAHDVDMMGHNMYCLHSLSEQDNSELKGACSKVNLSADQKTQIKDAFLKFKQNEINLEAKIKTAHLNYMRLLDDVKSGSDSANTSSQELSNLIGQQVTAQLDLKNQLMFKVLTPNQRKPTLLCEMQMYPKHYPDGKGGSMMHHKEGHKSRKS